MSFSSDLKEELSKINNLANKEQVKYELIGYLLTSNTSIVGKNIRYATESDYNINRYTKLLSNMNVDYDISVEGNMFVVIAKCKSIKFINIIDNQIEIDNNLKFDNKKEDETKNSKKFEQYIEELKEEDKRALVRGFFLGSGSINNPENNYHLEISFKNKEILKFAIKLFSNLDVKVKKMIIDNKYSIYLKEGEEISKILALMGANKAVLRFEEIRVQREMRGKVNRLVNCETANLNKTINASIKQIEAIRKLKETKKFNKLNDNLKEIAELRLKYPDMSLVELGTKLKQPVGKSGVNYRLNKIIEIAEEN